MIKALNLVWPYTGRNFPENAQLAIRGFNPKYKDLCWFDNARNLWVYISTIIC